MLTGDGELDKEHLALINEYGLLPLSDELLQKYGFSPLHLYAVYGDLESCQKLLKNGFDPNIRDRQGWTPLHHAAVCGHFAMIDLLLRHGADPTAENHFGGTYQQILKLTLVEKKQPQEVIPIFFKSKQIPETQMTVGEYEALTHTKYIEENFIPRQELVHLWLHGKHKGVSADSLTIFKQWRKLLSQLNESFVLDHSGKDIAGLGLFAKRNYSSFEVIGEYLGEVCENLGPYSLQLGNYGGRNLNIDASHLSNALSRINDGFPNLFIIKIRNDRGLPLRAALITLEEIHPGEQFCFNYGWHEIKIKPYVELRGQALRQFSQACDPDLWQQYLQKINLLKIETLLDQDIVFIAKFRYLLQTPTALCAMLLDGTLDENKTRKIAAIASREGHISDEYLNQYSMLINATSGCRNNYLLLQRNFPLLAEGMLSHLRSLLENIGWVDVVQFFQSSCDMWKLLLKEKQE